MKEKRKLLLLFFVILLVLAIDGLLFYQYRLHKAETANQQLRELGQTEEEENGDGEKVKSESADEDKADESKSGYISPIDFASLKEENDNIYAWIRIEDSKIDYPVLESDGLDPDYYVNHTVEGKKGYPGALFTEYDLNQDPFEDPVTIVYGHNMKSGSMFGSLDKWADEDYREAHSEIRIYTEEHSYLYQIAFVQVYDNRNILNKYDCGRKAAYQEFLDSLENVHKMPYWHSDEITVTTEDKLLILSTCSGNDRLLLGAVLREEE